MKLWILDEQMPTHRLIRLNAEEHSELSYFGDLSDEELIAFFSEVHPEMDPQTNLEQMKYFGYLHLFISAKKKERKL